MLFAHWYFYLYIGLEHQHFSWSRDKWHNEAQYQRPMIIVCDQNVHDETYVKLTCNVLFTAEYVKQCSRSDPKLITCLIDALHHLRSYLRVGISEIELPSVEPFRVSIFYIVYYLAWVMTYNLHIVNAINTYFFIYKLYKKMIYLSWNHRQCLSRR